MERFNQASHPRLQRLGMGVGMKKVKLKHLPTKRIFEVPADVASIYLKHHPNEYKEVKQRRINERNR